MARELLVETGLDEEVHYRKSTYTRHARTRFVELPKPVLQADPVIGDPWEPLTVRARLHRLFDVFRRMPHTPDTKPGTFKSCMPDFVREIFKDTARPSKLEPVGRTDLQAAMQILDSIVVHQSRLKRMLIWGTAGKLTHRQIAKALCCSHVHAAKRVQQMLVILAADWNARGWKPDADDIDDAVLLIHRKN